MTLVEKYHQAIQDQGMKRDAAQLEAIQVLQELSQALSQPNFAQRLRQRFPAVVGFCAFSNYFNFSCLTKPVTGLYLWGGVGRGKTWLMHLFFEDLPFKQKRRMHFHVFMQSVHQQLSETKKQKNPLAAIAKKFARKTRVLYLDEFIVTNITDAMLLSGLLEAFFKYGVTLIATSNRIPDDLYLNGLQRERFLPAIELIKTHTRVMQLDNGTDHRLALLQSAHLYYQPLTQENQSLLEKDFSRLSAGNYKKQATLHLFNRPIKTLFRADEIIWFHFDEICSSPRGAQDYVEIAKQFHSVFLSGIPKLTEALDDKARRFIYLIDALYDSNVKLFISAEQAPENLYHGRMLKFAFNRTCSRLVEMRSEQYLNQTHKLQLN